MSSHYIKTVTTAFFISFFASVYSMEQDKISPMEHYELYDKQTKKMSPQNVLKLYGEEQHIMDQALETSAPEDIKTIMMHIIDPSYLSDPDFRSSIFAGPPGSTKSTIARAVAYKTQSELHFIPVSQFQKEHRNQTGIKLKAMLDGIVSTERRAVIVLDEMNRAFENYNSEHHDSDSTASTFWTWLDDQMAKKNQSFFLIGTMNRSDKLPPQIQSRMGAGFVKFAPLSEQQLTTIFFNQLKNTGATLAEEYTQAQKDEFGDQIKGWFVRDLKQFVNRAKFVMRRHNQGRDIVLNKDDLVTAFKEMKAIKKDEFKEDELDETDAERQERHHKERSDQQELHFVQGQMINLMAQLKSCGEHGLSRSGYDEIMDRHITNYQRELHNKNLALTRESDDKEKAAKEAAEKAARDAERCSIQ